MSTTARTDTKLKKGNLREVMLGWMIAFFLNYLHKTHKNRTL